MASAAILMGGRSSRFEGRDKSALVVGGRTILDRQLAELEQVTDTILLIGGRSVYEHPGLKVVDDRVLDSGPLGGLDAALAASKDNELLVVACDMPCVTAPFLAHLLALTRAADAVVPRTERGYHPLCAAYTRACQAPVRHRLAEGRLAMLGLLEDVQVHVVERDDLEQFGSPELLLANVNTPDELVHLQALLGHER